MDAIQLHEFCRSVSFWPKKPIELSSAAEKIQTLLEASWVWLSMPEIGDKAAGLDVESSQGDSELSAYLHAQISRIPPVQAIPGSLPRQIQISEDALSSAGRVPYLTLAPIGNGAWLAIGNAKALNPKAELLLAGVTQHFASLARESSFHEELAMRDQFLSIASHELKTPLTSIYGILQLQERMLRPRADRVLTPEQEKQHSFFKIVIRQVERLNELIDGLLDVSRIQNGRFIVEPSESDVALLLQEAVNLRLQVIASEAGVRIQLDAPPHLNAWVDPIRFEEVITNLGMNAIRFSPEGGVVWMKLKGEGEQLILTVRDQGPCVTDIDKQRLFQPFERAQRTTRLGGLGLGLFISRQIAQLHGGTVVLAESIAGKGNLFEARFPLHRRQRMTA